MRLIKQIEIINKNPLSVMYLENISDELKILAIKKNPSNIFYIDTYNGSDKLYFNTLNKDISL